MQCLKHIKVGQGKVVKSRPVKSHAAVSTLLEMRKKCLKTRPVHQVK